MGLPQENPAYITPEAYLAVEMQSDTRSEYLKGEVFAMVGNEFNTQHHCAQCCPDFA